ncbi:MAG TPA: C4-dicarboxylate ABC transporter [Halothiobacillus sp.]|nr:C4-dicarboxylate ABC transporter [Halothiobacillus sp.]
MNTETAQSTETTHSRLSHMPVSLFAVVMGLAGLALAVRQGEQLWEIAQVLSTVLLVVSIGIYIAIAVAYSLKFLRYRESVTWEFNHPIRLSFFPAISIGLILIAILLVPISAPLAKGVLIVGATIQLVFTLVILSAWIHQDRFQITHSNPAWFIPIVGNILVPVGGAPLGLIEVSWFFFSIGLVFWIVLLAILMNRYFFHSPMPSKLLPTLFILIAPPAVGFISWVNLHGGLIDDTARILYYFGLFITLMLFFQIRRFTTIPFGLPWWAYSFPLAAFTIATMMMCGAMGGWFFNVLSVVLLVALIALLTMLVVKTIAAMRAGKICVPE